MTEIEVYNTVFKQKLETYDAETARQFAKCAVDLYVKSMPEPEPTLSQYKQFVNDLDHYIRQDMQTAPRTEVIEINSMLQSFFKSVGKSDPSTIESFEIKRDALDPVDQVAAMVLQGIIGNEGAYRADQKDLISFEIARAYIYADTFMRHRERRKQSKSE